MVAASKGKLKPNPSLLHPKGTNTVADGDTSFKIYAEPPDKSKDSKRASADGDVPFKRKPVTSHKGRHKGSADIWKSGFNDSKEIKRKLSNPVKMNAERKVLADISNVRGTSSRRKFQDHPKAVGIFKSSISGTQSTSSLSRRSYKTNARTSIIKPAANQMKLEKVSCNNTRACMDDLGIGHELFTASNTHKLTSGRNHLPPTRKSLPVRKQVHEANTQGRKEGSTTKSEVQKGSNSLAVKLKVGRNLPSRVSYAQSQPFKNRVSDGYMMISREKHKMDPGVKLRRSVNIVDIRTSGHNHLPPIRKSLSLLKPVNKTNTCGTKEIYTEKSEGQKGYGFPVKPKASRKSASCVSYIQSQRWKNRKSDECMMASRDKLDMDAGVLSRRSVKIQTTSKSKRSSGLKKPASSAAISSMPKQVGKPSSLICMGSLIPNEKRVEQVSGFSKSSAKTAADIATRSNAGRRKSFTSLLVSKLKEDLPSIYDDRNHLEVSEYVDDIYNYYWVVEAQSRTLRNYLELQSDITPQMRAVLINWLIEVHFKFDLMQETLFLMVTLLDQYLASTNIKKSEMQLAGLTALLLASKYEDFWHPRIVDLISVSAESYTRDQMLGMETSFLKVLKFRLNAPTPYVFMLRFLKAAQSEAEESRKFEHLAFYLIELCVVEYEALQYKPSLLSASAIYVARCTLQMTPAWTRLLYKHSNYEEFQLRQCAEMILKCHRATETTLLKVTYEKYMRPDFSNVASISPLKMLPQKYPK